MGPSPRASFLASCSAGGFDELAVFQRFSLLDVSFISTLFDIPVRISVGRSWKPRRGNITLFYGATILVVMVISLWRHIYLNSFWENERGRKGPDSRIHNNRFWFPHSRPESGCVARAWTTLEDNILYSTCT